MGYLDSTGLAHLWEKVKAALDSKQDTIIPGDGLSKEGDTLNVDNPVRGIYTINQWNALPEEQKAIGTYVVDDGQGGGGAIYDDQERVIGTWFGKPLYRKVYLAKAPSSTGAWTSIGEIVENMEVKTLNSYLVRAENLIQCLPVQTTSGFTSVSYNGAKSAVLGIPSGLCCYIGVSDHRNLPILAIVTYTKTTDPEVST